MTNKIFATPPGEVALEEDGVKNARQVLFCGTKQVNKRPPSAGQQKLRFYCPLFGALWLANHSKGILRYERNHS